MLRSKWGKDSSGWHRNRSLKAWCCGKGFTQGVNKQFQSQVVTGWSAHSLLYGSSSAQYAQQTWWINRGGLQQENLCERWATEGWSCHNQNIRKEDANVDVVCFYLLLYLITFALIFPSVYQCILFLNHYIYYWGQQASLPGWGPSVLDSFITEVFQIISEKFKRKHINWGINARVSK